MNTTQDGHSDLVRYISERNWTSFQCDLDSELFVEHVSSGRWLKPSLMFLKMVQDLDF